MKLKKFKYSFISALTLMTSAFAVVACGSKAKSDCGSKAKSDCGSKAKSDNSNYTTFLNSLNGVIKDKTFIEKNSSFSKFVSYFKDTFNYSIGNNINPENTYIFDNNNDKIKLSDLEYGGISIDKNSNTIEFKNGDTTIKLDDNTFFASNLDLSLKYNKIEGFISGNNPFTYNNLTSFFKLTNDTKGKINLMPVKFTNSNLNFDYPNVKPLINDFQIKKTVFKTDKIKDPKLGIDSNKNILGYGISFNEGEASWLPTSDIGKQLNYYVVDLNTIKVDNNKNITFTYNSIFANFYINALDEFNKDNAEGEIYALLDLTSLSKDENGFTFSTANSFIIYFKLI